jgi:hypothetical protein
MEFLPFTKHHSLFVKDNKHITDYKFCQISSSFGDNQSFCKLDSYHPDQKNLASAIQGEIDRFTETQNRAKIAILQQ